MNLLHFVSLALLIAQSFSFISPRRCFLPCSRLHVERDADGNIKKGPLEFLMDPKPTKIPPELRDEIYKAEANTEAARQRQSRIFNYGIVAVVLVLCAFGNVFLTELRSTIGEDSGSPVTFEDIGFGWVSTNVLFQFLFSTKIGGALSLFGGAAAGLLAEAEQDAGRKNAEDIWEELERRRANNKMQTTKKKKKNKGTAVASKKTLSASKKKRLAALSEVIQDDHEAQSDDVQHADTQSVIPEKEDEGGLMGKLKSWYKEADTMAASQALLINKELEERGLLEKVTDETGLKVIGRDAAAKLKEEGTTKVSDDKE